MARVLVVTAAIAATLGGVGLASAAEAQKKPKPPAAAIAINVLGNRADLLSGGDALVEIAPTGKVDMARLKVSVDGRDVTAAFAKRADGRWLGRVGGLKPGANVLTATAK